MTQSRLFLPTLCVLSTAINVVSSFTILTTNTALRIPTCPKFAQTKTRLYSNIDDDLSRQLEKAKELLAKAKAKVAEEEKKKEEDAATIVAEDLDKKEIDKKTSVTKSIDDNGLITTDGELMAALSEEEDWELKDLMDVFEDEIADSKGTSTLADRDVAASIFNMRMNMHNEDYRKVFDKRNFFIGEDN
jgi:hypothetical protein